MINPGYCFYDPFFNLLYLNKKQFTTYVEMIALSWAFGQQKNHVYVAIARFQCIRFGFNFQRETRVVVAYLLGV